MVFPWMAAAIAASAGAGLYNSSRDRKAAKRGPQMTSGYSKNQRKMIDWLADAYKGHRRRLDITRKPLYKQSQDYLSRLLSDDPEIMKRFSDPAMRQFRDEIMPEVAERFAGTGGRSSAFNNAMAYQGERLAENLALAREQMKQDNLGMALQVAQAPITNRQSMIGLSLGVQPNQPYFQQNQRRPGFFDYAAAGVGNAAGQYAASQFGNWLNSAGSSSAMMPQSTSWGTGWNVS